jgi:hypothetical protein
MKGERQENFGERLSGMEAKPGKLEETKMGVGCQKHVGSLKILQQKYGMHGTKDT